VSARKAQGLKNPQPTIPGAEASPDLVKVSRKWYASRIAQYEPEDP
ncbi:hypothetical protein PENNAL_c0849G02564, partial [Penicillium nalgiovense]